MLSSRTFIPFPGFAGIRITVGFRTTAAWIACSFAGSGLEGKLTRSMENTV